LPGSFSHYASALCPLRSSHDASALCPLRSSHDASAYPLRVVHVGGGDDVLYALRA